MAWRASGWAATSDIRIGGRGGCRSMVTLLPGGGEQVGLDSLRDPSCSWGGTGPAGGRRTVGPCLPFSDRKQVWARCPCDGASWRGIDPASDAPVPHPRRYGAVDTAGALGIQPGTFGNALSAPASIVQPVSAWRKHCRHARARAAVSADVHSCPSLSASDPRCPEQCDVTHMIQEG